MDITKKHASTKKNSWHMTYQDKKNCNIQRAFIILNRSRLLLLITSLYPWQFLSSRQTKTISPCSSHIKHDLCNNNASIYENISEYFETCTLISTQIIVSDHRQIDSTLVLTDTALKLAKLFFINFLGEIHLVNFRFCLTMNWNSVKRPWER